MLPALSRHNQLRDLPPALCELVQLKVLDVTANRFEELPEYLSKLPSLARLLAGSNALSSLPCDLGKEQPSLAEVVAPGKPLQPSRVFAGDVMFACCPCPCLTKTIAQATGYHAFLRAWRGAPPLCASTCRATRSRAWVAPLC